MDYYLELAKKHGWKLAICDCGGEAYRFGVTEGGMDKFCCSVCHMQFQMILQPKKRSSYARTNV